jgi:hypothetical protein
MIEQLIPYFKITGHGALTLALVSILAYFAITFFRDFSLPGRKVSNDLILALSKLREIKSKGEYTDLESIRETAMVSTTLKFYWDEFGETKHNLKN